MHRGRKLMRKYSNVSEHRNKGDEYSYIPDISDYLNDHKNLLDIINDTPAKKSDYKSMVIYLEPDDIWSNNKK